MLAVALDDFSWYPARTLAENFSHILGCMCCSYGCRRSRRWALFPSGFGPTGSGARHLQMHPRMLSLASDWDESIIAALLGLTAVAFWPWVQGLSGMHYTLMQHTRFLCHCELGWSSCNTLYSFLPSAPSPAMVRYTPANPEPKKAGDDRPPLPRKRTATTTELAPSAVADSHHPPLPLLRRRIGLPGTPLPFTSPTRRGSWLTPYVLNWLFSYRFTEDAVSLSWRLYSGCVGFSSIYDCRGVVEVQEKPASARPNPRQSKG